MSTMHAKGASITIDGTRLDLRSSTIHVDEGPPPVEIPDGGAIGFSASWQLGNGFVQRFLNAQSTSFCPFEIWGRRSLLRRLFSRPWRPWLPWERIAGVWDVSAIELDHCRPHGTITLSFSPFFVRRTLHRKEGLAP